MGQKASELLSAATDCAIEDAEFILDNYGWGRGESVALAGKLDWSPKSNWVEKAGGLPKPFEDMALALIKDGMSRSRAIATAVSRAKVLAAKGQAKYIAAVAQWEKMKQSTKAKK